LVPAVYLVILVDADPPGRYPEGRPGGRGFYPPGVSGASPDYAALRKQLDTALTVVAEHVAGHAVFTVHTSPLFRNQMFESPYISHWTRVLESGGELALHPHEDRPDGTTYFDDAVHLAHAVMSCVKAAADAGLPLAAFRTGFFAFNDSLPRTLERSGITVDLSPAPGINVPERGACWPEGFRSATYLCPGRYTDLSCNHGKSRVISIPIGWDGTGRDLGKNYLFSERSTPDNLKRVWDALCERSHVEGSPQLVNFLCHGSGLMDAKYRTQAIDFFHYAQAHGGQVALPSEAHEIYAKKIRRVSGP